MPKIETRCVDPPLIVLTPAPLVVPPEYCEILLDWLRAGGHLRTRGRLAFAFANMLGVVGRAFGQAATALRNR